MTKLQKRIQNTYTIINKDKPIKFSWNGKVYDGYEGDSLSSALYANNINNISLSYKYGRNRATMGCFAEEPNAIVTLEKDPFLTPNARATQVELYEGLNAYSANFENTLTNMFKALIKPFHRFIPAGFYYKTFMFPRNLWSFYENILRQLSGISKAPKEVDIESYDHMHKHCDVLIVGGGIAGLKQALQSSSEGKQIIVIDERPIFGGLAYEYCFEKIDDLPVVTWVQNTVQELTEATNVELLTRTTGFACHDSNLVLAHELRQDHLSINIRNKSISRQRIHKIHAQKVVLATGATERPIIFNNNDLPGIMLSSAALANLNRFAILPKDNIVVFSNNNSGVHTAIEYAKAGAKNVSLIDVRREISKPLEQKLRSLNVTLFFGYGIKTSLGSNYVEQVVISPIKYSANNWQLDQQEITIDCELVAIAGGWNPAVHLACHQGDKPLWQDDVQAFLPPLKQIDRTAVGALIGQFTVAEIIANKKDPKSLDIANFFHMPLDSKKYDKQFVDLQNDVTVQDIELAIRENYKHIELIKRYTALGFGTDQGKTSHVVACAIVAKILNKTMSEVGTTTYRPAYTPVTLGALAGVDKGNLFEPIRKTPMHQSHIANGAKFEHVGQWLRPWYFPLNNEKMDETVKRECLTTRDSLGIMDASTLGKIDIQGPDAREFLNRVYTNAWTKLKVGSCRYGLMLDENGMIFDDGVTACLDENHFLMTTTTGGAARVYQWLEFWLQTEWPDLKVYLTSVTDHWSTTAIVGPLARKLLISLCDDINFSKDVFPFMANRQGTIRGIPVRIMRISFSGELAYEINIQANYGKALWDFAMKNGEEYKITSYGTESMHVLRAEKGYIIVGQDTDGSVSPIDANMGWIVGRKKNFSWLGKKSLERTDTARSNRKQLVGLLTEDPMINLPEGSQLVENADSKKMIGHVTSSYYSPILNRSIAMALIIDGLSRTGEIIYSSSGSNKSVAAKIGSSVFFDIKGEKQDG